MQLPAFSRRRAQRFAELVDGRRARQQPDHDDDADLAVVGRLERLNQNPQADPDFRASLRTMLMASIERDGIGDTAVDDTAAVGPPPGLWSRYRRRIFFAGLTAAAVALPIASVVASSNALPGEPLYNVKRSAEQAKLVVPQSRTDRGQLLLDFARARAGEADAIAGDTSEMATILDQMDAQTREGVALLAESAVDRRDPARLDIIDRFHAEQQRVMSEVLGDVTGGARTRAVTSVWLLDDVKTRVGGLRAYIRCADTAPVQSDELGPKPHPCGGHEPGPTPESTKPPAPVVPTNTRQTPPVVAAPPAQPSTTAPPETEPPAVVIGPPALPGPVDPSPIPTTPNDLPTVDTAPDPQDVADKVDQLLGSAVTTE